MAAGLSERVSSLERVLRLVGHLRDRLKFLRPSVRALVQNAAAVEDFGELGFLDSCRDMMETGMDFPAAWKQSARQAAVPDKEAREILAGLGDILGGSDLESQLSAVALCENRLELRLSEARENAAQHKKLYCTLGALAGVGAAIILA